MLCRKTRAYVERWKPQAEKLFRYEDRQEQKVVMEYFISHIKVILIAGSLDRKSVV